MTRVVIGSIGTSSVAEQFFTTDNPRILEAQFKPHAGNASIAYVSTSSAISATNAWSFDSGSSFASMLKISANVKATTYWGLTSDTVSLIDYVFVLEN